jgi:hypothetical protein
MNRCDDSGEFKVLNDSIILFPDSIFTEKKLNLKNIIKMILKRLE